MIGRVISPLRLTDRLFVSQIVILLLMLTIGISIATRTWYVLSEDDNIARVVAAIKFDREGRLHIATTIASYEGFEAADRWIMIKVHGGDSKAIGRVPKLARYIADNDADVRDVIWERDGRQYIAHAKLVRIGGHDVRIIAPRGGEARWSPAMELALVVLAVGSVLVLMVLSLVGLTTTPGAIRDAVKALRRVTEQVQSIEPVAAMTPLLLKDLPLDVHPLIETINATLEKLRKAYADQGTFLRDAAHELRTPITILSLRANELPAGEIRSRIKADIARLTDVAEQLLDLQRAKAQDGNFILVDVNAAARQTLADLAPLAIEDGYQVAFEEDGSPLRISGDPISIERILTNLIQNAIRHGGGRGIITVRVSAQGYFEVGDEGPGIASEVRERVFDPFVRGDRSRQGTGLGLHLVRQMAAMHGASVSLQPGHATGTWMRVRFPDPT